MLFYELPVVLFQWAGKVHLWPILPVATHTAAEVSKSTEVRVSKVYAGMISVGRKDVDVKLVMRQRVDGSKQAVFRSTCWDCCYTEWRPCKLQMTGKLNCSMAFPVRATRSLIHKMQLCCILRTSGNPLLPSDKNKWLRNKYPFSHLLLCSLL